MRVLGGNDFPRDVRILTYVGNGLTDVEIGDKMFLSPRTVKAHLKRIYSHLHASNRAHAVANAYRKQILRAPLTPATEHQSVLALMLPEHHVMLRYLSRGLEWEEIRGFTDLTEYCFKREIKNLYTILEARTAAHAVGNAYQLHILTVLTPVRQRSEEEMHIDIRPNLDDAPLESVAAAASTGQLSSGYVEAVGILPEGMSSGKSSVAITIRTTDGALVVGETGLALFSATTRALLASPIAEMEQAVLPTHLAADTFTPAAHTPDATITLRAMDREHVDPADDCGLTEPAYLALVAALAEAGFEIVTGPDACPPATPTQGPAVNRPRKPGAPQ